MALAVSDLSPLFRDFFFFLTDSSNAKKYVSCRAPHFQGKPGLYAHSFIYSYTVYIGMFIHMECTASLVDDMHVSPFSLRSGETPPTL